MHRSFVRFRSLSILSSILIVGFHSNAETLMLDGLRLREAEFTADSYCLNQSYGVNASSMASINIEVWMDTVSEDPSIENQKNLLIYQKAKEIASGRGCLSCVVDFPEDFVVTPLIKALRASYPCPSI